MMDGLNGSAAKPTVLVVDDEPLVRMTTADMLRFGGFEVLEAAAGAQALGLLDAQPVAALVTDVRVRAAHPDMPVVFVSGDSQPDAAHLPTRTHYIRKPVNLRQLIATVSQAIADRPHETD